MNRFYNGVPEQKEEVNFRKETELHIRNKKLWLMLTVFLAVVADAVVAVLLGMSTKGSLYWVAPAGLALIDVLLLIDLFLVNLQQKYTVLHRVLFALASIILALLAVLLPTQNAAHTVMTSLAAILVLAVQAVKVVVVIVLSVVGKQPLFKLGQRTWCIALMLLVGVMLTVYVGLNFRYGFMGQRVSFFDTNCTLVYALDEKGNYRVEGCYDDGNVIDVPRTFNGKKVVAINSTVLDNTFVNKVNIRDENVVFDNVDDATALTDDRDLTITVAKSGVDTLRRSLFFSAWKATTTSVNARMLYEHIVPGDLKADEVYYNVSFGDTYSKEKVEYIPTVIKHKGEPLEATDLAVSAHLDFLSHKNMASQEDLAWCFERNDGYILARDLDGTDNQINLTFEKVYKLNLLQGNDGKWHADPAIAVQYFATSQAAAVFAELPEREGFYVSWITRDEAAIEDGATFVNHIQTADGNIDLTPQWTVIPPVIRNVRNADEFNITYGQDTLVAVDATGVLPVHYELRKGPSVLATSQTGDFALNRRTPDDSGVYTVVAVSRDESLSSLSSQEVTRDFTLTVNKKQLRLNWDLPSGTFSNEDRSIGCSVVAEDIVAGDSVYFTLDKYSVFDAGTYTVQATLDADVARKYSFAPADSTQSFIVTQKEIDVVWAEVPDGYTYTGQEQAPRASTFVFDQTIELDVSGKGVNAGTHTVTALPISANYKIVSNQTYDYTIRKKAAWVVDWTDGLFTYNADVQRPAVQTLGGILGGEDVMAQVMYLGDTSVRSVGDYAIEAVFEEQSNYSFVSEQTKTFTIQRKAISVATWDSDSFVYAARAQKPTVRALEGCVGGEDSLVAASLVYSDWSDNKNVRDDYSVGVTLPADSNYYFPLAQSTVYAITPYLATVHWSNTVLTYNAQLQSPSVTIPALGEDVVTYNLAGAATDAGIDYTATVTSTNANYTLSGATQTYVINPYGVRVEWSGLSIVYDGDPHVPTATGLDLHDTALSISTEGARTDAGTGYAVTAAIVGNANYYIINSETTFAITPKEVAPVWSNLSLTFNGRDQAPTATVQGVKGTFVTVAVAGAMRNVGEYNAYVTTTDGNYSITEPLTQFSINPMPVVVSWGVNEFVYNGRNQVPEATAIGAEDEVIVLITEGQAKAAGTEYYTASVHTNNANYTLYGTTTNFSISPKTIGIEWTGDVFAYNGNARVPTATATMLEDGDVCGLTVEGAATNAGEYTATVTGLDNANYRLPATNTTCDFVIERIARPAAAVVYASSVYGDVPAAPGVQGNNEAGEVTYTFKSATQGDEYYTSTAPTVPGSYVVRASISQTTNYLATEVTANYVISKRIVELEWGSIADLTYNGAAKVPTVTVTNIVGADVVLAEASVSEGMNNVHVGRFTFTVHSLSNDRYTLEGCSNVTSSGYTILPKAVSLQWSTLSAAQLEYSAETKALTADVTNLETGDTCHVSVAVTTGKDAYNVGTFSYTAMSLDNADYTLADGGNLVSAEYTITRKALSIAVNDHTITYGDAITYGGSVCVGLAGDDTVASIGLNVVYGTDYTRYANVGSYTITCTYDEPRNYTVGVTDGALTVQPRPLSVLWGTTSFVYNGAEQLPIATAGGLAGNDTATLTVTGAMRDAGTDYAATVTAVDNGNYTLPAADLCRTTFSIMKKTAYVLVEDAEVDYLAAAPTFAISYAGFAEGEDEGVLTSPAVASCAYVAGADAGRYAITLSGVAADNYTFILGNATLTVDPIARTTPVVGLDDWDYRATPATPTVTNGIEEEALTTVTYYYAVEGDGEWTTTVPTSTGAYSVKVTLSATTNYLAAESGATHFAINRATRGAATVSIENWRYGYQPSTPVVSYAEGEEACQNVTFYYAAEGSEEWSTAAPVNAGSYRVKAILAADANYLEAQTAATAFQVEKMTRARPVVSIDDWIYGEEAATPTVTTAIAEADETVITFTYAERNSNTWYTEAPQEVGEYKVRAMVSASTNYAASVGTEVYFEIKRIQRDAPVVQMAGWTYGEEAVIPTLTEEPAEKEDTVVTYYYAVDGEDDWTTECPTEVGAYLVKAELSASAHYAAATSAAVAFAIESAE